MSEQPFFSIIIPVYKVEPYLRQCIDSVLNQTFRDFEIILVDDGSPDKCPQICDEYAKKYHKIRTIHKVNGGASSARNEGLKCAKGQYISFLDSDDFWIRNTVLQDLHELILEENSEVVIIKMVRYYENNNQFSNKWNTFSRDDFTSVQYEDRLAKLIFAQAYRANPWNKVFARKLMDEMNLYFTEGIIAEDIDWAARLCLAAHSISILPEVAHGYRYRRADSLTSSLKLKNLVDTKGSIERCIHYVNDLSLTDEFRYAYFSYIAYRYVIWMAESAVLKDVNKKPLIKEMKQYQWLLKYDGMRRVKMVKRVYQFLGFDITATLLGMYLKKRAL